MEDATYKTQDIFEASWLYTQHMRLLGLEPNGRYFNFVFGNAPACKNLSADYWRQDAQGNIKQFVDSLKTLKDLVFSKQPIL